MPSKLDYLSKYTLEETSTGASNDRSEKRKRKEAKKSKKKKRHKDGERSSKPRSLGRTNNLVIDDDDFPISEKNNSSDDDDRYGTFGADDDDGPVVVGYDAGARSDESITVGPKGVWKTVGKFAAADFAEDKGGSGGTSGRAYSGNPVEAKHHRRRQRHDSDTSSSSNGEGRPAPQRRERHDSESSQDEYGRLRQRGQKNEIDSPSTPNVNDSNRRRRYDSSSEDEENDPRGRDRHNNHKREGRSKRDDRNGDDNHDTSVGNDDIRKRYNHPRYNSDNDNKADSRRTQRRRRHDSDDDDDTGSQGNRAPPQRKRFDSSSEDENYSSSEDENYLNKNRRSKRHYSSSEDDRSSKEARLRQRRRRYDSSSEDGADGRRHRRRHDSDDDDDDESSSSRNSRRKEGRLMSSGHKSGLQNYQDFNKSEQKIQARKHEDAQRMVDKHGMGETVFRDKNGRRTVHEDNATTAGDLSKEETEALEAKRLNEGRVQREAREAQASEMDILQRSTFARYRDDDRLEEELKNQIRKDDPMAKYALRIQQKKSQQRSDGGGTGGPAPKPIYKGPPAKANRFGIRPGYRWDGNDRGNGFEDKLLAKKYSKSQEAERAYRWRSADM